MRDVWQLCYGEACWDQPDLEDWARLDGVSDEALWAARGRGRTRLVEWARRRLALHLAQRGTSAEQVASAATVLDPDNLTIGFARRFAEYKRPTLFLSQPNRLRRLLTDPDRPIQLVIAGKAHPRDDAGKALIAEVVRSSPAGWIEYHASLNELAADLDAYTARVVPRAADKWGPLVLPLIAWQR